MRSTSVNENSFVALANSHGTAPERFVRRSKSVPILSTKTMAHWLVRKTTVNPDKDTKTYMTYFPKKLLLIGYKSTYLRSIECHIKFCLCSFESLNNIRTNLWNKVSFQSYYCIRLSQILCISLLTFDYQLQRNGFLRGKFRSADKLKGPFRFGPTASRGAPFFIIRTGRTKICHSILTNRFVAVVFYNRLSGILGIGKRNR